MTQARFKIVFSGELMPDMALDTVKDNLAQLFKSNRSRVESLFSGATVPLKRDLPEDEADKYLIALQNAGAKVRKEPDLAASLTLVDTETPEPAQVVASMNCPKCGHEQAKSNECSACGIIIDKYLARQAQLAANPPAASTDPSPYSTPKAQVAEELPEYAELKVFSVQGRIGRVRYLAWSAVMSFIFMAAYFVAAIGLAVSPIVGGVLITAVVIAAIVVSVQIGVQRLHDLNWSGWLWLLMLVPIANFVIAILMLVVPGTPEANRFGPPPPPNSTAVKVLAFTWLGLPVLIGILAAIAVPAYQDYTERAEQAQHTDSATTTEE